MEAVAVGNVVAAPEVGEVGEKGRLRARFSVAVDDRYQGSDGVWRDGESLFFLVEAWGELAQLVRDQVDAGTAVIVVGRWRAARWQTDDGSRRRQWIAAETIGRRLRPPQKQSESSQTSEIAEEQGGLWDGVAR